MRSIVAAVIFTAALSAPAAAKDITLTLSDQDQVSWGAVGPVFEQCVSGASMRGDASACRQVYGFLGGFAEKVKAAQAAAQAARPAPEGSEQK